MYVSSYFWVLTFTRSKSNIIHMVIADREIEIEKVVTRTTKSSGGTTGD